MLMRDKLNSAECSKYLRALADPDRLKIVQCLQSGPKTVGELCAQLNAQVGNISHHLKQLRIAGVACGEKRGRFVIYSLAPELLRGASRNPLNVLEFGCCRIELGEKPS
jgi:ArsR family transcriptional regulator